MQTPRRRNRTVPALIAIGVLVTLATVTTTSAADPERPAIDEQAMAEARKHFQAGVNLLDDPDGARYEEAHHAFQKAYELSRSPKVLGNIGFCSLKLERDGEAIDAYTTYLRETPDVDPRERAQIEKDIATLTSTVASFQAAVKGSTEPLVLVDTRIQTRGSPIVNAYAFTGPETMVRLRPGRHSFKMKSGDLESVAYEVTIEPTAHLTHEFTFAPPTTAGLAPVRASRPSYAGPVLAGILGVAALGTGTVTGLLARSKERAIASRCPNDVCPADYDLKENRTAARTLGTVADATLIGGGVAVGGALLWALLVPRSDAPRPPRMGSVSWDPGCTADGCRVEIGGRF